MSTLRTGARNGGSSAPTIKRYRTRAAAAFVACVVVTAALAQTVTKQRLFVVEEVSASVESQFSRRGAVHSYIIHQSYFDPDDNGLFEHHREFRYTFATLIPADYNGPVCLDWEGQGMFNLGAQPGSTTHARTLQAYIEVLRLAQEVRPRAQIGYYNLPIGQYWNRNAAWRNRNLALKPILDQSDCLFPSVYDYYKTGESESHSAEADLDYVRACVQIALELADGKPVYPYISTRYHFSNPRYGMNLIPAAEFKSHIAAAFDPEFRGDKADGLVWWGADRYFRWLGQQQLPGNDPAYWISLVCRVAFAAEIPPNTTDDTHFNRIHKRTLRQMADVISAEFN